MPLTDVACRIARPKPDGRPNKLADGGGLYLLVAFGRNQEVGRYWRWDYRYGGKRKTMALGTYPAVPLASVWKDGKETVRGARTLLSEARNLLASGTDPWMRASRKSWCGRIHPKRRSRRWPASGTPSSARSGRSPRRTRCSIN